MAFLQKKKQLERDNQPDMKERLRINEEIEKEQKANFKTKQDEIIKKKAEKHQRRVDFLKKAALENKKQFVGKLKAMK